MSVLQTRKLTMRFGGVTAVDALDITVEQGEIVALIGPNGAGKTTAFNVITGVYKPTEGDVHFLGERITGRLPNRITRLGIARTFQNIRLFRALTVMENVLIARHVHRKAGFLSATLRLPWALREEQAMRSEAEVLLRRLELWHLRDEIASSLPYGQQRRLEIARALATNPKILLLDEPAAGMNPQETLELTQFVRATKEDFGLTVFMIEHHMDLVMEISDRIYVLDFGKTIAHGNPADIQSDPRVIEAYLGVPDEC